MTAVAWAAGVVWLLGAVVTARWALATMRDLGTSMWPMDLKVGVALLALMMVVFWPITWWHSLTHGES